MALAPGSANLSQLVALRQLDCLPACLLVALHRHRPVLSILVVLVVHTLISPSNLLPQFFTRLTHHEPLP
jgi:hypothetical protein